ncbi:MAG: FAD binding domain-containing protein [Deltaproteobacteria bacterium]|nr:FAD binding domain-containing protein [Deltaproteobacteria bacterium]MBW2044159.1 FAD binding domain-containing protein [Deltaproteobacteria bacterium]MBW2300544.1 FAD binding domain-containing protein [Deltaproteobacteria bacterium]
MKRFAHLNARTLDEAVLYLRRYGGRAKIIAGGTDVLGRMKDEIVPTYPEALINIKTIPGLDFIEEREGSLKIGALTKLEDIARHPVIKAKFSALAEAARRTASPHIREMGTIAGNICQDIRCWYYRAPNNRFPCLRKGGGRCYAIEGDNRYHSIFGASVDGGCLAVHPSDIAPALIALDAKIRTSERKIKAEHFFEVGVCKTNVLEEDEIVTEIEISQPPVGSKSAFIKFAARETIDFPVVNCAATIVGSEGTVQAARICLNAVYLKPYRVTSAEQAIIGKTISDNSVEDAGIEAVRQAKPLARNTYMVQIARTLVKRAVLACG